MKLSQLLLQREALLRQARLSNLAFAYCQLDQLATRVRRAGLHGEVGLRPADPATELYFPELTALEGSQSVIEEHFTDEDIAGLDDLVEWLSGSADAVTTFRLEEMAAVFVTPLRRKLEQAGVDMEGAAGPPGSRNREGPARR